MATQSSKVIDQSGAVYGIDVSHHNGSIDWEKVVENEFPRIEYVFMKATQGTSFVSPKFKENWSKVSETRFIPS